MEMPEGNGGTGSIKIKDGTWNGKLAHIKDIDIQGGQLNNKKRIRIRLLQFKNVKRSLSEEGSVFAKIQRKSFCNFHMIKIRS